MGKKIYLSKKCKKGKGYFGTSSKKNKEKELTQIQKKIIKGLYNKYY